MHFSFWQKQRVINGQRFGRCFPLHPPFHPCWTILVGRISSVKWTGVQQVALRLGVIVFAPIPVSAFHYQAMSARSHYHHSAFLHHASARLCPSSINVLWQDHQSPSRATVAPYTLLSTQQMLSLGASTSSVSMQQLVPESLQRTRKLEENGGEKKGKKKKKNRKREGDGFREVEKSGY